MKIKRERPPPEAECKERRKKAPLKGRRRRMQGLMCEQGERWRHQANKVGKTGGNREEMHNNA